MVSSKKLKEKKPQSGGVYKDGGRTSRSSGPKTKNTSNKVKLGGIVKREPEVYEISDSSSSDSVEEQARGDEPKKSNGVVSKGRNGYSGATPAKRRKNGDEDDGDDVGGSVEGGKTFRFPMNRIPRIMRSDNSAPQIMQDAVFLVNKATMTGKRQRADIASSSRPQKHEDSVLESPETPRIESLPPWPKREDMKIPSQVNWEDDPKKETEKDACLYRQISEIWDEYDTLYYNAWLDVEMRATRFTDINAMMSMGIRKEVLRLVQKIGLGTLPTKQYDLYPDLARQFLATARVYYTNEVVKRAQEGTLTFLIRGVRHRISIMDLCTLYGISQEPTGVTLPTQFHDVQALWSYFGNGRFESKSTTQTDIRHPILRYVARLVANSILCKMEPGKMRLSELIMLYYAIGDIVPELEFKTAEPDNNINMGAVFAHHLVSLKTKPFLGKGSKTESVGSLLTPIFQHCSIRLDNCKIIKTRSLMNEEHLKNAKWIKTSWRWYFRDANGADCLIQLPQRKLTTIGDDPLQLRFEPDPALLISAPPARLRRGASSRAPPVSSEDDPVPQSVPRRSTSAQRTHQMPSLPDPQGIPMDPFQKLVWDSLQIIWMAVSRCTCMHPPAPRARFPTPPLTVYPAYMDGIDDVSEED